MQETTGRTAHLRSGVRLEMFTVGWLVVETVLAVGAGIVARSLLLTAFGIDSLIELVTGAFLLRRLAIEVRGGTRSRVRETEKRATWVTAGALVLLCGYVLITAVVGLLLHSKPESSPVGIAVSIGAVIVMPWLAWRKRIVAGRIGSDALRGDAASSLTCGYMAGTVLIGLLLNALFHWWWAEDVAALLFLIWLVQETRETLEEARESAGSDEQDDREGS